MRPQLHVLLTAVYHLTLDYLLRAVRSAAAAATAVSQQLGGRMKEGIVLHSLRSSLQVSQPGVQLLQLCWLDARSRHSC